MRTLLVAALVVSSASLGSARQQNTDAYYRLGPDSLATIATLYGTGLVGTRPRINAEVCTRCGVCVETCPLPNVINLQTLKVDYNTCQRCLLCYEACPEHAISVKG